MTETCSIVRQVTPDDMPMLKRWAERRGCILDERLLSPHGFLAETAEGKPILCAWAALMMDVPIVHVDHVYLPRRFALEDARAAWDAIISAVQAWVRIINQEGGYGYALIEIVMNPTMTGEVERHGGQVSRSTFKKTYYPVN